MKKLRLFLYISAFLLVAALAAGIILRLSGGLPGAALPSIIQTSSRTGAETILIKTAPLQNLALTGMTVKVVFPHDLYPQDYNWKALLDKRFKNDEEETLYTLYTASKHLGMDLTGPVREFIVLTFDIECGIELNSQELSYRILPADSGKKDEQKILLHAPSPVIQSIRQRDMTSSEYPYPGLEVSPKEMSEIVSLSESYARKTVLSSGILETTAERGRTILSSYLTAMGFTEAEIIFGNLEGE